MRLKTSLILFYDKVGFGAAASKAIWIPSNRRKFRRVDEFAREETVAILDLMRRMLAFRPEDPAGEEPRVLQTINLEGNEVAVSMTVASFTSQEGERFLIVGTGKDMVVSPRQFSASYIYVYHFHKGGRDIEFIHKTKVEEPPMALLTFQG